jgi:hypothetical protein
MPNINIPWRQRVAADVINKIRDAAVKIGIAEPEADRFVLRSMLMSAEKKDTVIRHKSKTRVLGKIEHAIGARRTARKRAKASRKEQQRKGLYRRAQG